MSTPQTTDQDRLSQIVLIFQIKLLKLWYNLQYGVDGSADTSWKLLEEQECPS